MYADGDDVFPQWQICCSATAATAQDPRSFGEVGRYLASPGIENKRLWVAPPNPGGS